MNKGQLFLVSAPSGAGKTSMVRELLKRDSQIKLSISHTTREPRTTEEHGKDYFFVKDTEFNNLAVNNDFLEYAEVYGNYYGTSKQAVTTMLEHGFDVILEIDWQGAAQVMRIRPDTVHISIAPPSVEALRSRLSARGLDDSETIDKRMQLAEEEISHLATARYIVVNDEFEQAVSKIHAIFIAERQRKSRQQDFINNLLAATSVKD